MLPRIRPIHGPALPPVAGLALVTGASSGIGAATAAALAGAGFEVLGTSRRGAAAPAPRGVRMIGLDLADPGSIAAAAEAVRDRVRGRGERGAAVLVANAGESQSGPLEELPRAAWERLLQVNVVGQLDLVARLLPGMRAAGRGRVVLVGSMLGSLPLAFRSSYVASKAALRGAGLALRGEVAPFGIGVSVVEPGSVATGIAARRTRHGGAADSPYRGRLAAMLDRLDANEAAGVAPEAVAGTILAEIRARRPAAYRARGSRAALAIPLTRLGGTQFTLDLMDRVHGLR